MFSFIKRCLIAIGKVLTFNFLPTKYLPITQFLILLNVGVFILQVLNPVITETYAFTSSVWYSYFTACFLHGNIGHLAGNLLFLSLIFPPIEKKYGSLFIFLAYLFTGMVGNLLFALFLPEARALGASGSICGIMVVWTFHNILEGRPFLVLPALFYFMMQGINSGIGLIFPNGVGYLAHYGAGLGAFFLLPWLVYKRQ